MIVRGRSVTIDFVPSAWASILGNIANMLLISVASFFTIGLSSVVLVSAAALVFGLAVFLGAVVGLAPSVVAGVALVPVADFLTVFFFSDDLISLFKSSDSLFCEGSLTPVNFKYDN